MALATTCPRCQTGFRVVPDQLKIRRGLVRCGHCRHVFSGLDSLRYVGDTASASMPALSSSPAVSPHAAPAPAASPSAASPSAASPSAALPSAALPSAALPSAALPSAALPPAAPPSARGPEPALEPSPSRRQSGPGSGDLDLDNPETLLVPDLADEVAAASRRAAPIRDDFVLEGLDDLDDLGALTPPSATPRTPHQTPHEATPGQAPGPIDAPDTRDTSAELPESGASASPRPTAPPGMSEDASAAWSAAVLAPGPDERRSPDAGEPAEAVDFFAPPSRAGGFTSRGNAIAAVACGALGIALVVQVAIVGRDWLVAQVPAIEAGLGSAAALFGTTVAPPRQLTALTLESFDVHTGASAQALVLNALLRNQAPHRVRWPSMELTLTDAGGTVIVRKVLSPAEYLSASQAGSGVPPERELPLQVALEAVGIQPSGYNVKLFYP